MSDQILRIKGRRRRFRNEVVVYGLTTYVIQTDPLSEATGRYTVYRLDAHSKSLYVVGRELSLIEARKNCPGTRIA